MSRIANELGNPVWFTVATPWDPNILLLALRHGLFGRQRTRVDLLATASANKLPVRTFLAVYSLAAWIPAGFWPGAEEMHGFGWSFTGLIWVIRPRPLTPFGSRGPYEYHGIFGPETQQTLIIADVFDPPLPLT